MRPVFGGGGTMFIENTAGGAGSFREDLMKSDSVVSGCGCFAALCFVLAPATSASGSAKKEVTFNKDVASILYNNCAECHKPDDIAPMSLLSYKEVRPWARSIREKVVNREMPPWSPDPAYGEFTNDHRLTQKDVDTITAWVDQGAKEGDAKDLPKAPAFVSGGWEIGKPDVVLHGRNAHCQTQRSGQLHQLFRPDKLQGRCLGSGGRNSSQQQTCRAPRDRIYSEPSDDGKAH